MTQSVHDACFGPPLAEGLAETGAALSSDDLVLSELTMAAAENALPACRVSSASIWAAAT
jgi:hypothetical protein